MPHWLSAYLILCLVACPLFAWAWWRQRRTRNAGTVDVLWTVFTGGGALAFLAAGSGDPELRLLVAVLIGLWCIRLSAYVLGRMRDDGAEDGRYSMLRERWGARADLLFFGFFQLQVGFVLLFLIPFALIAQAPATAPGWWLSALALWLIGNSGAMVADRQLAQWRRQPEHRGETCRQGLWAWSRHPNYFFEWLHWCSYPLFAVAADGAWLAWITPAVLLVLLLKVTGIPYAERQALRSRGEDYRRYQREVSAFIPLPPTTSGDPS